jgi:hypothetical protein
MLLKASQIGRSAFSQASAAARRCRSCPFAIWCRAGGARPELPAQIINPSGLNLGLRKSRMRVAVVSGGPLGVARLRSYSNCRSDISRAFEPPSHRGIAVGRVPKASRQSPWPARECRTAAARMSTSHLRRTRPATVHRRDAEPRSAQKRVNIPPASSCSTKVSMRSACYEQQSAILDKGFR